MTDQNERPNATRILVGEDAWEKTNKGRELRVSFVHVSPDMTPEEFAIQPEETRKALATQDIQMFHDAGVELAFFLARNCPAGFIAALLVALTAGVENSPTLTAGFLAYVSNANLIQEAAEEEEV